MDAPSPQSETTSPPSEGAAQNRVRPLELLIGVVSLLLVATVVAANMGVRFFQREIVPLSQTVVTVRTIIQQHKGDATVVLAPSGFPVELKRDWFHGGEYPLHTETGRPLVIDIVDDGIEAVYPVNKVFDARDWEASSAWYNVANGAFCVRVVAGETPDRTLALFNEWNLARADELHSITANGTNGAN